MSSSISLSALYEVRNKLMQERHDAIVNFNAQIKEIESSIELLSGKKVMQNCNPEFYDDTNPNYIRQSIEEI